MECAICRENFTDTTACVSGHYVCNDCLEHPGTAVIRSICTSTKSKNSVSIAVIMMNSPAVYMHGADHHVIVAAALFAAYKNCGGNSLDLNNVVDESIKRESGLPYGICASSGTSGGAVSAEIFHSIIAKTEPLSIKKEDMETSSSLNVLTKLVRQEGRAAANATRFVRSKLPQKTPRDTLA